MMTFEQFQKIPPGEIFRVVTTKYHTVERVKGQWPMLTFVCIKGMGHNDWGIYCHHAEKPVEWIREHGDKVTTSANILSIFPCDPETLNHYRL